MCFLFPLKITLALEEDSSNEEFVKVEQKLSLSDSLKENILVTEFYPNPKDGETEWVEIYNSNDSNVELVDWFIDDIVDGGSKAVTFSTSIPANSYVVIDLSKSIFNNSGSDAVSLLDDNSFPLHIVKYTKTLQGSSIQNVEYLGWSITEENTKGKENLAFSNPPESKITTQKNSSLDELYSPGLGSLSASEKENIFITEFSPYPGDGHEWVEIYNDNDHSVDLVDWKLDDDPDGGGTPITFSAKINKDSYKVIEINKSLLNNLNDKVALIDDLGNTLHVVSYSKSVKGGSIQKLLDSWYITEVTTRGERNLELTVTEKPSTKDEEVITLSPRITTNDQGEVLGTKIEYRTIPIYDMTGEKYLEFYEPQGKVYVVTEKELPNSYEKLINFFSKAFW